MKTRALERRRLVRVGALLVFLAGPTVANVEHSAAQEAEGGLFKVTIDKSGQDVTAPDPRRFVECDFSRVPDVDEVQQMIRRLAKAEDFPEDVLMAIARQESTFRMDTVSSAGAVGVMQLMPMTAQRFGVDRCQAEDNIRGGIRYLRTLQTKYDNLLFVLAAYNAGEAAVDRYRGMPPFGETLHYVANVSSELYGWKPFDGKPVSKVAQSTPQAKDARADTIGAQDWSQGFVFHVEEEVEQ